MPTRDRSRRPSVDPLVVQTSHPVTAPRRTPGMSPALVLALLLLGWAALSLPLAVAVGRSFRAGHQPD